LVCAPWYTRVEWYTPEEMTRWRPPDYWIPRPIIAFARSGSGDEWCWFPELTDDLGTRVVFCAHDENDAEIYATNFQAFLYRILLESFAYIGPKGIADFVGALRAIYNAMDCGSGAPQPRDGLHDKMARAENQTLNPGLEFGLELGGPVQEG
jgi:hypothetical protein